MTFPYVSLARLGHTGPLELQREPRKARTLAQHIVTLVGTGVLLARSTGIEYMPGGCVGPGPGAEKGPLPAMASEVLQRNGSERRSAYRGS